MKVLYVDLDLGGHRKGYLKAFTDTNNDAITLLPQKDDELACKQFVYSSEYHKKRNVSNYLKWIKEISYVANTEDVDVIHFLCGDALYRFFGLFLGKFTMKKPIIITYHHMKFNTIRNMCFKNLFSKSIGVVHTEALAQKLNQIGINNVCQIEYPIFDVVEETTKKEARQRLGLPQDKIIMSALGATHNYKGLDILLKALESVEKDYLLLVAGMERDLSEAFVLEHSKSYSDKVDIRMKRKLTDKEFKDAIVATDILVLPYRYEFDGASGPMIEGVWAKKYIIGAKHGSMGDLIEKYQLGSTFETENPEDLARVIDKVLLSDISWNEKAELFRNKLGLPTFLDSYAKVYERVVK